jgi:FixJ family two-component response regulator
MNGLELAARLRELDPSLRIVIVSGCLSTEAAALARSQARGLICAFLNKPFLHQDILALIGNLPPPARAADPPCAKPA